MKLRAAVRLLRLLPSRYDDALTVKEIVNRWHDESDTGITIRSVQRYMSELSADGADGPALVEVRDDTKERKYYLRLSHVAQWFMTETTALDLLLARQVIGQSFGPANQDETQRDFDIAERLAGNSARISYRQARLRIVPDGIGRQRAQIDPAILKSALAAIESSQKLAFRYAKPSGTQSDHTRSPLGLVAKDGTIYLLATKGFNDAPIHFALHRILEARVVPQPATPRADFDLDRYIDDSHQLSHRLDATAAPIALKLRVDPEAMFHFTERPLSRDQTIDASIGSDGWRIVTATVPVTILLVPFLISMGPWIEVLEPDTIRTAVGNLLHKTSARYPSDT